VQAWLQRAILAGGALPEFAGDLVVGDPRLGAADRVGVYAAGYRARLLECLRSEYPALRRLAGDTAFDLFAADFIASHQSRRPSLYDYGRDFAAHLAARAPPEAREPGSPLAIPAQLARLERARAEVSRAPGEAPPALGPGVRLRISATARLLRLGFDFAPLIEATERDAPFAPPAECAARVAVTRIGWRVRMLTLGEEQMALLESLPAAVPGSAEAAAWLPHAARLGLVTAA